MDKGKAIDRFLGRVDQFSQVALITSEEMERLFGEEVAQALAQLEHFLTENRICPDCGGACCRDIGCELYASQFGQCPIHEYRPIACRLHFCHRLDDPYRPLIIELRDVFVGCYRAIDLWDSPNLKSLDSPPFAEVCPQFVAGVSSWVNAVREGRLAPDRAGQLLCREAEGYRRGRASRGLDSDYSRAESFHTWQDRDANPGSAGQSSSAGTSTLSRDLFL
jgi:hypothetical protein